VEHPRCQRVDVDGKDFINAVNYGANTGIALRLHVASSGHRPVPQQEVHMLNAEAFQGGEQRCKVARQRYKAVKQRYKAVKQ
jgi:hypothetical protein